MNEHWAELLIASYLPVPKHGCGAEHPKVEATTDMVIIGPGSMPSNSIKLRKREAAATKPK